MAPFVRRRREGPSGPPRDREARIRAIADPIADIRTIGDPGQALRRRLWLWNIGARIGAIATTSPAEEQAATPHELIALAAIQAEAGLLTTAAGLVERAVAADRGAFDQLRFVGLTAGLHAIARGRFERYAAEAEAADLLRRSYGTFRRLVEANAGSVCVVGNAPSEVGRGLGGLIDSHTLVIRFNNYAADPDHWPDYGRKTDVWIRGSHYRNVMRRTEERYSHVVIADDVYWRVQNGQNDLIDSVLFGRPFEDAPRRLLTELTLRLGARPSSGLIVLAWLRQILGTLDAVSVFGFALSDQIEGLRHYYKDTRVSRVEHDWIAERAIFDELVPARREGSKNDGGPHNR